MCLGTVPACPQIQRWGKHENLKMMVWGPHSYQLRLGYIYYVYMHMYMCMNIYIYIYIWQCAFNIGALA